MATTITEIKGTVSTTDENIPKELLKTYTPVSVIYNSIGLMLVMAFAGAVNFITIKSPIIEELSNRDPKTGVLTTKNRLLFSNFVMFFIFSSMLFAYMFGVYYKIILNGKNNLSASMRILFCIFAIMGITYMSTSPILLPYINIVKIFENTVGYAVVNTVISSKLQTALDILFSHREFSSNRPFPNMSVTYNFMLSVLSVDNYKGILEMLGDSVAKDGDDKGDNDGDNKGDKGDDNTYDYRVSTMADMINKFKNGEIVKNMDDTIRRQTEMNRGKLDSPNAEDNKEGHTGIKRICIRELAECVLLKHFIGQLCWVFISALITILVTLKFLSQE
jgi:hypothetical protein